jgi:UDP-N-acetylglucosamine 2-epimerase (non-hydrolysing)
MGTRPEIIKLAPVIHELKERHIDHFVVHSNQHYSHGLDKLILDDLGLNSPDFNLEINKDPQANQIGHIMIKLEKVLAAQSPDILIVQGDTNTTVAGGMVASKLGIKVAHVEAGLRSYDKRMPEEINRIIVDHLSDYLFAVTDRQKEILLSEGIEPSKIYVVGNTICDSLFKKLPLLKKPKETENYFLCTFHRASNVDSKASLGELCSTLKDVCDLNLAKLIWPIHPRTEKRLEEWNLTLDPRVKVIPLLSYEDFLSYLKYSDLVLTDSGGLQEEACILNVPCITLRESTERPETIDCGANTLTGLNSQEVLSAIKASSQNLASWESPYGKGVTSQSIISTLIPHNQKPNQRKEKACVIGLGYIGFPFSLILSQAGYQVTVFDKDKEKLSFDFHKRRYTNEKGIASLIEKTESSDNFLFSEGPIEADYYVICVPTPAKGGKCDLTFVIEAFESILKVAPDHSTIIVESTVNSGCFENELIPRLKGRKIKLAYCPERAIPGNTIFEMLNNDRVIGAIDQKSEDSVIDFYQNVTKANIFTGHYKEVELVKLMENSFRDVNIAFANEMREISLNENVDIRRVVELANKHPRVNILSPGTGVGGHCIPVDPIFLSSKLERQGLLKVAREINLSQPSFIFERIEKKYGDKIKSIGIAGLAYKPGTDDTRNSPALELVKLFSTKYEVICFDPYIHDFENLIMAKSLEDLIDQCDLCLIATLHEEFENSVHLKQAIDNATLSIRG